MAEIVRAIAWISDLHIGSKVALFPPEWTDEDGNTYTASAGQRIIHDCWNRFWGTCDDEKVDTVYVLADVVHGLNPAERGFGNLVGDLDYQKLIACDLLRPHLDGRKLFMVSGSTYHESKDYRVHRWLVEALRPYCREATFLGVMKHVRLLPTDKIANVAHGATAAVVYPATKMDRDGLFAQVAESQGKLPHASWIIRGHGHEYIHLERKGRHSLQLPCWKGWEPSKLFVDMYGMKQPSIGGAIMFIDSKHRIVVHHFLLEDYGLPHPHLADFTVDG
jgi:hypothetical protein